MGGWDSFCGNATSAWDSPCLSFPACHHHLPISHGEQHITVSITVSVPQTAAIISPAVQAFLHVGRCPHTQQTVEWCMNTKKDAHPASPIMAKVWCTPLGFNGSSVTALRSTHVLVLPHTRKHQRVSDTYLEPENLSPRDGNTVRCTF